MNKNFIHFMKSSLVFSSPLLIRRYSWRHKKHLLKLFKAVRRGVTDRLFDLRRLKRKEENR